VDVDMTVIGAGPVGLYAAYHAGFRGKRTAIVDSLAEPGGQIAGRRRRAREGRRGPAAGRGDAGHCGPGLTGSPYGLLD
jgi:NADPH-dependent 2,4-dienoyl-CoA reductase/sulfur reductase-like enzyme